MKVIASFCAMALFAFSANASLITIDPDDYPAGHLFTGASDEFDIRTIDGQNIYSSPLFGEGRSVPENFTDSGPIGERVFSASPTSNSEWMLPILFSPRFETLSALTDVISSSALVVEFFRPVSYLSIFALEIFGDAGFGGGSDPISIWLFSPSGELLTLAQGGLNQTTLPGSIYPDSSGAPSVLNPYAYFHNHFSFPEIGYMVMGGESEPTTIDRLQFVYSTVPEPAALSLLALGLAAIGIRRRYS